MVSPAVSLPQTHLPMPEPRQRPRFSGRDQAANVGQVERVASIMLGSLLVAGGLKRFSLLGLGAVGLGVALIQRGSSGECPMYKALGVTTVDDPGEHKLFSHPLHQHIRVEQAIAVHKPVEEVYGFWRNLENFPRFMDYLESVQIVDEKRSLWKAKTVLGKTVQWNADIVAEEPNKRLAWKSIEGADVPNAGQVVFEPLPDGTLIRVLLVYEPPAGVFGALFAKLMGKDPAGEIKEDLRHLKQLLESGETPTVEGQPRGTCKK